MLKLPGAYIPVVAAGGREVMAAPGRLQQAVYHRQQEGGSLTAPCLRAGQHVPTSQHHRHHVFLHGGQFAVAGPSHIGQHSAVQHAARLEAVPGRRCLAAHNTTARKFN